MPLSGAATIGVLRAVSAKRDGAAMPKLFGPAVRDQRGFTLIEILIVAAILGLLAGVAIPNVAVMRARGAANAANTELANVHTAAIAYLAEHLGWPSDSTDLDEYLQGQPKATYVFDGGTGFVVSVSDVTWSGIHWYPPAGSPPSADGLWDR
jgi:prepilin-type N-terminal cleavage/methylation domain-containing protein